MAKDIRGILPPIVTPFTERGDIDFELAEQEMELCLKAGAHGLSVGGSTGEGPALKDEELARLIRCAKKHLREDQPLICGVMRMCTQDAVRTGLAAREAGADAIMVTPTAYNVLVPNQEGMFDFYSTISREVRLPVIIYNVIPQNEIKPPLFRRLLDETEWVKGIKQSVGGIQALYAMKMAAESEGWLFAATDEMIGTCFEMGVTGAISAILALFPELCVEMWDCARKGDRERVQEIQKMLYYPWMCLGGSQFPLRMKYALKILGRDGGYCRSPIVYLPQEEKGAIEKALAPFAKNKA